MRCLRCMRAPACIPFRRILKKIFVDHSQIFYTHIVTWRQEKPAKKKKRNKKFKCEQVELGTRKYRKEAAEIPAYMYVTYSSTYTMCNILFIQLHKVHCSEVYSNVLINIKSIFCTTTVQRLHGLVPCIVTFNQLPFNIYYSSINDLDHSSCDSRKWNIKFYVFLGSYWNTWYGRQSLLVQILSFCLHLCTYLWYNKPPHLPYEHYECSIASTSKDNFLKLA